MHATTRSFSARRRASFPDGESVKQVAPLRLPPVAGRSRRGVPNPRARRWTIRSCRGGPLPPGGPSTSDDRANERANQGPDRDADYRHHSHRIEMTQRGSARRYGPIQTQDQKEASTGRRADRRPPSVGLQGTCLHERAITRPRVRLLLRLRREARGARHVCAFGRAAIRLGGVRPVGALGLRAPSLT